MVLLHSALWLVQKTHTTLSTNQMQNHSQPRLGHSFFSRALCRLPFFFLTFLLSWRAVVIAVIWNALSLPGSWRFLCALKHLEAKPRVKINLFRPKAPAHISHNCRPTYANTFSRSQYDSVRLNCDKSLKLKPGVQRIFCSLDDGGS